MDHMVGVYGKRVKTRGTHLSCVFNVKGGPNGTIRDK